MGQDFVIVVLSHSKPVFQIELIEKPAFIFQQNHLFESVINGTHPCVHESDCWKPCYKHDIPVNY